MPGRLIQGRVVAAGIARDRVGDGSVHDGEIGEFLPLDFGPPHVRRPLALTITALATTRGGCGSGY